MEQAFNTSRMTKDPFQDPMGDDGHQGLERFLQKFHQPGVPSHTIITDPEYYVFLWFHDAMGQLIDCPYTNSGYSPKLGGVDFGDVNKPFQDGSGIQSGTEDTSLPPHCLDLTPFVREMTLPEIAPAGGDKITTLFGETAAGAFSPYASDGQKSITLQVLDTEYSILDAIFYPWMKDINSPWWYRPGDVFTKWATPYPMATLEVQRPRMRYRKSPQAGESRNDGTYVYYSYRFLGVKPTQYSAWSPNGGGQSTLLRSLTMVADMCLVDLLADAHITDASSTNLGNRRSFIFSASTAPSDPGGGDDSNEPSADTSDPQQDLSQAEDDLDQILSLDEDNQDDMAQQEDGEQPGEEWPDEDYDYPYEYDWDSEDYQPEGDVSTVYDSEMDPGTDSGSDSGSDSGTDSGSDSGTDSGTDSGGSGSESPTPRSPIPQTTSNPSGMDSHLDKLAEIGQISGNAQLDSVYESNSGRIDEIWEVEKETATPNPATQSPEGLAIGVEDSTSNATGLGVAVEVPQTDLVESDDGDLTTGRRADQDTRGLAGNLVATTVKAAVDSQKSTRASGSLHVDLPEGLATDPSVSLGQIQGDKSPFASGYMRLLKGSGTAVDSESPESGQFSLVEAALRTAMGQMGWTAFGVCSQATDGEVQTLTTGILPDWLSVEFPSIAQEIESATTLMARGVEQLDSGDYVGSMESMYQATNMARGVQDRVAELNSDADSILEKTPRVGQLVRSVSGSDTQGVGLGEVVQLMTTHPGNLPTPIETYVQVVTGLAAKGSTKEN